MDGWAGGICFGGRPPAPATAIGVLGVLGWAGVWDPSDQMGTKAIHRVLLMLREPVHVVLTGAPPPLRAALGVGPKAYAREQRGESRFAVAGRQLCRMLLRFLGLTAARARLQRATEIHVVSTDATGVKSVSEGEWGGQRLTS